MPVAKSDMEYGIETEKSPPNYCAQGSFGMQIEMLKFRGSQHSRGGGKVIVYKLHGELIFGGCRL